MYITLFATTLMFRSCVDLEDADLFVTTVRLNSGAFGGTTSGVILKLLYKQ